MRLEKYIFLNTISRCGLVFFLVVSLGVTWIFVISNYGINLFVRPPPVGSLLYLRRYFYSRSSRPIVSPCGIRAPNRVKKHCIAFAVNKLRKKKQLRKCCFLLRLLGYDNLLSIRKRFDPLRYPLVGNDLFIYQLFLQPRESETKIRLSQYRTVLFGKYRWL